jgi:predicted MFS family arabinose efflux permease
MWELYTFWVLVPLILATQLSGQALSFAAFGVLGIGAVGCIGGGWLAKRWGSARVATLQLSLSGMCCLLAPWLLSAPLIWFLLWLAVWGITAAGDSPQFSTLTASNAPKHAVGSVLTLTNCIGFAISIVSIELFTSLAREQALDSLLPWLGIGPLLGIFAMSNLWSEQFSGRS